MTTITLFSYQQQMYWTWDGTSSTNQTWPMTQYNQKIYKGVDNTLQILVKSVDRRPINLANVSLSAQMVSVLNSQTVLVRPCTITDISAGKATMTLTASDVEYLPLGFYNINVTRTDTNTNATRFLYSDQFQDIDVAVELFAGTTRELIPATVITQFTPTPVNWYNDTLWVTGALPADSQTGDASGTNTWSVYTTNWLGKLWIQGSLTQDVPVEEDWFNIPIGGTTDYLPWTGTSQPALWSSSITMNLYWIRFLYINDAGNTGTFDKILYKS
jgi:hypothetical protein